MTKRPRISTDDMEAAVQWLLAFEGDPEMGEKLERVAEWLESHVENKLREQAIQKILRDSPPGTSWAQASDALDRVLQGRE
jgi:ferric-dicitrate binding protein FerR (iron transport regulator)